MEDMAMIAGQLRKLIDDKGWSIETTAKRTGVHREMISKILRAETLDPRLSTLRRLSIGLGVDYNTLLSCLGRDDEKS